MITTARVAVFGGEDLRSSVLALGLEPAIDAPDIALIDARDATAIKSAATLAAAVPRVIVVAEEDRDLLVALGVDARRVVTTLEPAKLGPILAGLMPAQTRSATRVLLVTAVRGGVGRTMLAANIATRIAPHRRVCLLDATGSGAASWWLQSEPRPWSDLESLVDELTADHLSVMADDVSPGLRIVGGASWAPSAPLLAASIRAAMALDDLVIIDAPLCADALVRLTRPAAPRALVLAYDDPWSRRVLDASAIADDDWLIASQTKVAKIGTRSVFRSLPRDEGAVASAVSSRAPVRGALGKAYDELAELILADAS
ncbi:MAG TPA: hypothetical protein VM052_00240 [Candidatus Limnocylindrales bacterium]|nr:hypothetical protein [Candidatus Limnocylindrales bacterium]